MALPAPKVNLLAKKKARFDEQQGVAVRAKVVAGVLLIVYFVVTLAVAGLNVYVRINVNTVESQIKELTQLMMNQTTEIQRYSQGLTLLSMVQTILNQRRESIDLWNQIQMLVPAQCELTHFSMEDNILHIGIRAPHVFLAQQVITMTETNLSKIGVSTFTSLISRADDASYTIQLDLTLSQSKGKT
jgi:cell division protein FtsL